MSALDVSSDSANSETIELPIKDEIFKHLRNARRFGMDIGGSLVKIAYSSSFECKEASLSEDESSNLIYSVNAKVSKIPTLNFIKFETKYIEAALDFIARNITDSQSFNEGKSIKVTGGGAHKYRDLIIQKLHVDVEKEEEMDCLINGCNFLIKTVPNEVFTVDHSNYKSYGHEFKLGDVAESLFPYLLVNIGSGVSILKVESDTKFERIGGSCLGGATLWGLGSLLTNANGFDEILELAEKGDNTTVDMLVKDIYGGGCSQSLGLDDNLIASSLGKATRSALDSSRCSREEYLSKFNQEDLVKSILIMICYELSQLASLHARLHDVKRVYFGGYFIRKNFLTMKFLKHGINFWSKNALECLFLRHEGYLGAVGAFLKCTKELDHEKYSWHENYAHSSGFPTKEKPRLDSATFDCFELNREEKHLVVCPLLNEKVDYVPDLIDLTKDNDAREYWLDCFERTISTYEKQCVKTCSDNEVCLEQNECTRRAYEFKKSYLAKLGELRKSPFSYGMLTVRSLLDLREHCMSEFGFFDVYLNEKREENRLGLEFLGERCRNIDELTTAEDKWHEIFKGVLAGNVYDYGAQAFIQKQQSGHLESFKQALNTVDDTLRSLEDYKTIYRRIDSYKSICIFIDNSGFDVVLGILPLVIEFLKTAGTKVILCANSKPAINDITCAELTLVIKKACLLITTLRTAYTVTKALKIIETGSASPCLDLSRINSDLAALIVENQVDLVVMEGMGRSIHTNYHAKFKCDSLKIAILKNKWLAERFGFMDQIDKKFPIVFKFEPAV